MRVAVVSDIHGNLPALEAVLADLEDVRPDLVVQGGDVALGGPHPHEVVDRVRELGWPSVLGNTDDVLAGEEVIALRAPGFVAEAARRTIAMLGADAVRWLTTRPLLWMNDELALVHAAPGDCWAIVPADADEDVLRSTLATSVRQQSCTAISITPMSGSWME